MTSIDVPTDVAAPTAEETLRAYFDAIMQAEPIQQQLWAQARLTLTQLRILRCLEQEGPLPVSRLGRSAGCSSASMTRIVDRLEERRLVCRSRRLSDRRAIEVSLTGEGRHLVAEVVPVKVSAVRQALEAMGDGDRRNLFHGLRCLVERLRAVSEQEDGTG
jgi:MarR family 2-MHQ and catechol resistance regulon transcriptional repressor